MNCLECRKPLEKGKYCSGKCGNAYRVRMHRLKVSGVPPISEKGPKSEPEGVKSEAGLDPSLKNTINDPNPDWNYKRFPNVTEGNKTITCPMCGKLSLTHEKMCQVTQGSRYPQFS